MVLRVPADTSYVRLARTAAASILARLDFTIDSLSDVDLAIDEAAAVLLSVAGPGSELEYRFAVLDEDSLRTEILAPHDRGQLPGRDSFHWAVLAALTDDVSLVKDPDGRIRFTFVNRRHDG